jgi:hypothetical protein
MSLIGILSAAYRKDGAYYQLPARILLRKNNNGHEKRKSVNSNSERE